VRSTDNEFSEGESMGRGRDINSVGFTIVYVIAFVMVLGVLAAIFGTGVQIGKQLERKRTHETVCVCDCARDGGPTCACQ